MHSQVNWNRLEIFVLYKPNLKVLKVLVYEHEKLHYFKLNTKMLGPILETYLYMI